MDLVASTVKRAGSGRWRVGMQGVKKRRSLVSYTFSNTPLPWAPGVAWKEGSWYSVLWFQDTSASRTSRGSSAHAASCNQTPCMPARGSRTPAHPSHPAAALHGATTRSLSTVACGGQSTSAVVPEHQRIPRIPRQLCMEPQPAVSALLHVEDSPHQEWFQDTSASLTSRGSSAHAASCNQTACTTACAVRFWQSLLSVL